MNEGRKEPFTPGEDAEAERFILESGKVPSDLYDSILKKHDNDVIEIANIIMHCNQIGKEALIPLLAKDDSAATIEYIKALLERKTKVIDGSAQEVILTTSRNFLTIMQNDPYFDSVYFNNLRNVPVRFVDSKSQIWTDKDDAAARTYIEEKYKIFHLQKYNDAFLEFQYTKRYDPIQRLIEKTTWDGTARIDKILCKWLNAEDSKYTRECARLLFAGGINRAYNPGCKFDDVIVLQGSQGGGKSTFCRWLALDDDLYTGAKTIQGQKGYEAISGKWIVELEELLATLANNNAGSMQEEFCKAFLSTAIDTYRLPYSRRAEDFPRHCIFIGTTNQDEFLTDKTGNRRWYPIKVHSDGRNLIQHEAECKEYIRQCWAEMKFHFDRHDEYALPTASADMIDIIKEQQKLAEEDDGKEGIIGEFIADKQRTCILEIWRNALHPNDKASFPSQKESREIGNILINKFGWERAGSARFPLLGVQKSYHNTMNVTD